MNSNISSNLHTGPSDYESARQKRLQAEQQAAAKSDQPSIDAQAAGAQAAGTQTPIQVTMTPTTATITQSGQLLGAVTLTNMGVVYENQTGNKFGLRIPNLPPSSVQTSGAQISPSTVKFLQGSDNIAHVAVPGTDASGKDITGTTTVPVNFWDMLIQVMVMLNKSSTEISNISMQAQMGQGHLRYGSIMQQADKQVQQAQYNLAAGETGAATQVAQGASTIAVTSASQAAQRSEMTKAQNTQAQTEKGQTYASDKPSGNYIDKQVKADPKYQATLNTEANKIQAANPGMSRETAMSQAKEQPSVTAKYNEIANKNVKSYDEKYQAEKTSYNAEKSQQLTNIQTQTSMRWQSYNTALQSFTGAGGKSIESMLSFEGAQKGAEATRKGAEASTHETAAGLEATALKSAQDSMTAFQQAIDKLMNLLAGFWNPSGFRA
jgi:hypothetical protein